MTATVYWPGYIFIVGKYCIDYIDGRTLTILKLCTGSPKTLRIAKTAAVAAAVASAAAVVMMTKSTNIHAQSQVSR